jgi:hypothetical protein
MNTCSATRGSKLKKQPRSSHADTASTSRIEVPKPILEMKFSILSTVVLRAKTLTDEASKLSSLVTAEVCKLKMPSKSTDALENISSIKTMPL